MQDIDKSLIFSFLSCTPQEVGSLQSRLTTCEDEKGTALIEKGKLANDIQECQTGQDTFRQQAVRENMVASFPSPAQLPLLGAGRAWEQG